MHNAAKLVRQYRHPINGCNLLLQHSSLSHQFGQYQIRVKLPRQLPEVLS